MTIPLGKYSTVFQAEMCAILTCAQSLYSGYFNHFFLLDAFSNPLDEFAVCSGLYQATWVIDDMGSVAPTFTLLTLVTGESVNTHLILMIVHGVCYSTVCDRVISVSVFADVW